LKQDDEFFKDFNRDKLLATLGITVEEIEHIIEDCKLLIEQESSNSIRLYSSYTQSIMEMLVMWLTPLRICGKEIEIY